jgi:DNA repair exonuclease SbcCD nuclease subunit
MLRLLHTADVHLGARHADLGDRASAQRERQFAAFVATIDLAIAEQVDLVLIAGDLFDSNVQPRRSVERVAGQLRRLVDSRIRTVITPGTHDVYDGASIYRSYDLPDLAGSGGAEFVTVLTPDAQEVHFAPLDVVVHGQPFATKRAPHSPLRGLDAASDTRATWHVGLLHAAVAIPGQTDGDEVVITTAEIGASNLDYLALGHWHSFNQGNVAGTAYAYSGAPEPVALHQDRAGQVLLVTLDQPDGLKRVDITPRQVGRTRFERVDLDAAAVASQPALVATIAAKADPDLVLDVRLIGVRPDELDLEVDEVERELDDRFMRLKIRDRSIASLTVGPIPPTDTVLGAFIRDLEARIAEVEAAAEAGAAEEGITAEAGDEGLVLGDGQASELRDALRLGRLLLAGEEVTL